MTQQQIPERQGAPSRRVLAPEPSRQLTRWIGIATVVSIAAMVYAAFFFAPEDAVQGQVQRIFYVHVASAWIAALAFGVVFVGSIVYLVTRNMRWDAIAGASAEVGLLFTSVVLVTGMLWGKAIWGVFWTWEPRLTSVLVLWLLYLAYVAIRMYVPEPTQRARFSAVLGIVAFLDVPIVYLSVKWWRTLHPEQVIVTENGPQLPGSMLAALMVGLVAMTLVFVYFVRLRLTVVSLEDQLKREVAK